MHKEEEEENKEEEEDEKEQRITNNIVQKYLSKMDENFLDINSFVQQTDICKYCFKGELIPLEDEGLLICNQCSRKIQYLIENKNKYQIAFYFCGPCCRRPNRKKIFFYFFLK